MPSKRLVAACLTYVFGSIPATYIAVLPAMATAMLVAGLFSRPQASELPAMGLLFLWGISGLYGTIALWLVPFFRHSAAVKSGLVVGLLAISPVTIAILVNLHDIDFPGMELSWETAAGAGFLTAPAVAIGWLYHLSRS